MNNSEFKPKEQSTQAPAGMTFDVIKYLSDRGEVKYRKELLPIGELESKMTYEEFINYHNKQILSKIVSEVWSDKELSDKPIVLVIQPTTSFTDNLNGRLVLETQVRIGTPGQVKLLENTKLDIS